MLIKKRAQAGVEYMIIIGFVTFAVMAILVIATVYSGLIKDKIKINQLEKFSMQVINHAESVFFAGEPSSATVRLFLPQGVSEIQVDPGGLLVTVSTSTGDNVLFFNSRVPLEGIISVGEGIRTIKIEAKSDHVLISG